jgi:hypothetical protein
VQVEKIRAVREIRGKAAESVDQFAGASERIPQAAGIVMIVV